MSWLNPPRPESTDSRRIVDELSTAGGNIVGVVAVGVARRGESRGWGKIVPTETTDERELVRVAAISPVRVYVQGLTQLFHTERGIELVWSAPGIDVAERLLANGGVDVLLGEQGHRFQRQ